MKFLKLAVTIAGSDDDIGRISTKDIASSIRAAIQEDMRIAGLAFEITEEPATVSIDFLNKDNN